MYFVECKEFQITKIKGVLDSGINPSVPIIPSQPIPSVPPVNYQYESNTRRLRSRPQTCNTEYWKHAAFKRNVKSVPVRPISTSDKDSQTKFVIGGTQALIREFPHMVWIFKCYKLQDIMYSSFIYDVCLLVYL